MNLLGNIVWLLLGGLAVAVPDDRRHSVRNSGAQVRIAGPAAVRPNFGTDRSGNGLFVYADERDLVLSGRDLDRADSFAVRRAAIHHDCRHTVRQTAFQADEHGSHAVRAQHCPDRRAVTKRLENPHTL